LIYVKFQLDLPCNPIRIGQYDAIETARGVSHLLKGDNAASQLSIITIVYLPFLHVAADSKSAMLVNGCLE
jgi:hypothetical protein